MQFRSYLVLALLGSALAAFGGEARIIKVLPQLLDLQGRNAINPSLFDRDAYQLQLRQNPEQVSAVRFEVQYKTREIAGPLVLRLEMRGANTRLGERHVFETEVKAGGWFSRWGRVQLDRATSEKIGALVAWRATLLQNGEILAQQESHLW